MRPPEALAEEVVRQNTDYHDAFARVYDADHAELSHLYERWMLRRDLDALQALFPSERLSILEVGAGTGRVTIPMLKRGWDVTALDVSKEMLKVCERKAQAITNLSGRLTTIVGTTDEAVGMKAGTFHAIAFSSVLHHIPNYLDTVEQLLPLLQPRGCIYIAHEPLSDEIDHKTISMRIVKAVDYLLCTPFQLFRMWSKWRARYSDYPGDDSLVEFHDAGRGGLDHEHLFRRLSEEGFLTRRYHRYKDRKSTLVALLDTYVLRTPNSKFRLIAQRSEREQPQSHLTPGPVKSRNQP